MPAEKNAANILHITDLHFKQDHQYQQSTVTNALLLDLEAQIAEYGKPDLILFTGDLVHSADEEKVYDRLYDVFLEKLLDVTKCGHNRIIFTPGNHDLQRSAVAASLEKYGDLRSKYRNPDAANTAYFSGEIAEISKERLANYHNFISFFDYEAKLWDDGLSSVYDFPELSISVVSINTAWSGFAGIDKASDLRALLLPEASIANALGKVVAGRKTILAQHHPESWLTDEAESALKNLTSGRISMRLFGHVHDPRPSIITDYEGSVFSNQSGALYSSREDRYMGYSYIRFSPAESHLQAVWRTYFPRRREFDAALDISNTGGIFYSSEASRKHFASQRSPRRQREINEWRQSSVLAHHSAMFAGSIVDRPLADLFVPPPLVKIGFRSKGESEEIGEVVRSLVAFEDFVASNDNYLVLSYPEYGKTTLLQQLCLEISRRSAAESGQHSVPVLLDFRDFSPGTGRVERAVRAALPELPANVTVLELVQHGMLTICVDDVEPTDAARMRVLSQFISSANGNRFVLSSRRTREADYMKLDLGLSVTVQQILIEQFTRGNVRTLVRKWDNQQQEEERLLDRVISELRAMNVPQTPINSSLLLDIISADPNYTPINRASLIEKFIEVLLNKRSATDAQRKKFDFTNQVHFLGHVAEHMCRNNVYILPAEDLLFITSGYLKKFGLSFDSRALIDSLVTARILHERAEHFISFRFRAFLEYFVAKRMCGDSTFKGWILEEGRYLSYINEIEYFTGLQRSDVGLLTLIGERHERLNDAMFGQKFADLVESDDKLLPPMGLEDSIKYSEDIADQLEDARLTDAERDEVLEAEIPRDSEGRQEVFRPVPRDIAERYILSLFTYCNVVKNSELVDDRTKREHLARALMSWAFVFFGSFLHIPSLVKNRRMNINGLRYVVSYPKEYSDNQVARLIAVSMPKEIARLIFLIIGTEKLESQLSQSDLAESLEPKIVKFFRASLYVDLRLPKWSSVPNRFSEAVKDSRYFQEAMLLKATDVYRLGSYSASSERELQDHIGTAHSRLFSKSRSAQSDVRSRKIKALKTQRLLRVLRGDK